MKKNVAFIAIGVIVHAMTIKPVRYLTISLLLSVSFLLGLNMPEIKLSIINLLQ
jgi:hypothetical protein